MREDRARCIALYHMGRHGLLTEGWNFGFNNRKRALGICRFIDKRIELSRHAIELNDAEEILDTILHEIAHALAGPWAGHGPKWKAIAKEIGARPERATDSAEMPAGRWNAICRSCGAVTRRGRHRRTKLGNRYHGPCGTVHGKLKWVEAVEEETI